MVEYALCEMFQLSQLGLYLFLNKKIHKNCAIPIFLIHTVSFQLNEIIEASFLFIFIHVK